MTGPDPQEVARLLRQRSEMGLPPIVLREGSRESLLEVARRVAEDALGRGDHPAEVALQQEPQTSLPAATGGPAPPAPPAGLPPKQSASDRASEPSGESGGEETPGESHEEGRPELQVLDYPGLREVALQCTRCELSETRTQVVFSDGSPEARLVVVGEAPGANEDRTGVPFVGQAGKLLDLMLASIDLSREDSVYICNVLKCRPPGNRNPKPHEIRACSPFLRRQLELVQPQALLAVGTFAAQLLTAVDAPLGKLRGTVHSYQGIPLVATYHPAALLRNSGWVRSAWDDLQLLRQVMD